MEKIWRWAVIGSGKIVEQFLKGAAHEPRFHLEGIYSRTQERAQAFAQKVCGGGPIPRLFTSLEALAVDPCIDAVYIASPNALHAQQAILLLEHGKHVLCEKPFAASLSQAEAMLAAARNGTPHAGSQSEAGAPLVLMEAMKTTLLPNFACIREALPRIGTVRRYFAQFCQYSSRYDAFKERGVVPNVFDPAMAGGSLLDLGVYGLAPLVHLFGMPPAVPAAASPAASSPAAALHTSSANCFPSPSAPAWLLASALPLATGVDAQGTVVLNYPGMQAVVIHSKIADSTVPSEIQGENGRIVLDKLSTMIHPHLILRDGTQEDLSVPTVPDDMFYEIHEFTNLMATGQAQSVENSWSRTLDVMQLMDWAGEVCAK